MLGRILEKLFRLAPVVKEDCPSCRTLREQLEIANREKREALETILSFIRPNVVVAETQPKEILNPIPSARTWTQRRQQMERASRSEAQARTSPFVAQANQETVSKPNLVESLEAELNLTEEKPNVSH